MIIALLIAGIGFLLTGLLGVAYGIPIKEFSFGNTMIVAGAVMACTGAMMIALCVVVRELRAATERLEMSAGMTPRSASPAPLAGTDAIAPADNGFPFNQTGAANPAGAESAPSLSAPPPWQEETAARERSRDEAPPPLPAEAAPAPKQRRNLLFSSTLRRDRERAETRRAETSATDAPTRRGGRAPSTFSELNAGADRAIPAVRREDPAALTVLRSGVVDGMAYTLYSDGSIEAQLPEGMMRFASIDELRAYLDQRV
ncbi:MAG: DUF308 domain-containing protein [Bradyrhizobium sp.]|nr:DUF308 domain-containing protein [Bradyrhizobium sp.]